MISSMSWWIYVLIYIITTIVVVIIDYNLQKWLYKTPELPSIISGLFFWVVFLYFLLRGHIDFYDSTSIYSIIAWIFSFIWIYSYFKALFSPSTPWFVGTIWKIQMIIAFFIGVFIFQEHLSVMQLIGHGLIFLGVVLVSMTHLKEWKNRRSIFWAVTMWIAFAISLSICDYLYKISDFSNVFWLYCLWVCIWSIICLIFVPNKKQFYRDFFLHPWLYLGVWVITEFFWLIEFTSKNLALSKGPFTVVVFLMETYIAFLVILSVLFHSRFPKIIPKEWGDNWVQNFWVICMVLVGIWMTLN